MLTIKITKDKIDNLIPFSYFYLGYARPGLEGPYVSLNEISAWSDKVEINLWYSAGYLYFECKEDLLSFQLKWC